MHKGPDLERHTRIAMTRTSRGLDALLIPVPSLVYMSSALPAFGKHKILSRGAAAAVLLAASPGNHLLKSAADGASNAGQCCAGTAVREPCPQAQLKCSRSLMCVMTGTHLLLRTAIAVCWQCLLFSTCKVLSDPGLRPLSCCGVWKLGDDEAVGICVL